MKCVLDTNIYRSFTLEKGDEAIRAGGWEPYLSPLNALEILGLRDEDDKQFAHDFGARRSAAQKMLAWCSSGDQLRMVPDPEVFQAQLLGCTLEAYDYIPWYNALQHLAHVASHEELRDGPRYVDVGYARKIREAAYSQFCDKVRKIKADYGNWFAAWEGPPGVKQNNPVLIMKKMVEDNLLEGIISNEYERIVSIVGELQADEAPAIAASVKGSPTVLLRYWLFDYAEFYMAYLRFVLETGKEPDKNDFGDLQFAAYAAGGLPLVTNEKQWHHVAARTRSSEKLHRLP